MLAAPCAHAVSQYDSVVMAAHPSAFWDMSALASIEPDVSGSGHVGTYRGQRAGRARLPNGEMAAHFNHPGERLTVPSSSAFSIPRTGRLSFEGWIRPDTLRWSAKSDPNRYGYLDWMGKCEHYAPTCEWEARMYSSVNPEGRCDRISAYAFNPGAGLGSGADWQPRCGMLRGGQWLYVVGEYQTPYTPSDCKNSSPGTINIWVNGVQWNQSYHSPTGCMSQESVEPKALRSPLDIGTMAMDTWFAGAIGKVAIYDYLMTQAQINAHYGAMTSAQPSGTCRNACAIPVPTPYPKGGVHKALPALSARPAPGEFAPPIEPIVPWRACENRCKTTRSPALGTRAARQREPPWINA